MGLPLTPTLLLLLMGTLEKEKQAKLKGKGKTIFDSATARNAMLRSASKDKHAARMAEQHAA